MSNKQTEAKNLENDKKTQEKEGEENIKKGDENARKTQKSVNQKTAAPKAKQAASGASSFGISAGGSDGGSSSANINNVQVESKNSAAELGQQAVDAAKGGQQTQSNDKTQNSQKCHQTVTKLSQVSQTA